MKKLYLDLETTGLDLENDYVIQIAGIIDVENGRPVDFDIKMKPPEGFDVPQNVLDLQGITKEDLTDRMTLSEGFNKLLTLLQVYIDPYKKNKTNNDKFVVIGHNINKFDIPMLEKFFKDNENNYIRSYIGLTVDTLNMIDMLIAQGYLYCKSRKLVDICDLLDIKLTQAHDALNDVIATKELYLKLTEAIESDITKLMPKFIVGYIYHYRYNKACLTFEVINVDFVVKRVYIYIVGVNAGLDFIGLDLQCTEDEIYFEFDSDTYEKSILKY